jgi:dipeptidyl aminopeptidase/acylaminoacyl peptidase
MRKAQFLLAVTFLFLCASGAVAQNDTRINGLIVEQTPCTPNPIGTYEQYVEASKSRYGDEVEAARREGFRMEPPASLTARLPSREEFERRKAYMGFECRRIKYLSDGLKVVGFIWKPKNTEGKKFPLIIFNHGGNREFGKLIPWAQFGFYPHVSNGFVVIASQYRGVDGGEGREEFGGADVNDVLSLIPLAKSLGYVDMKNVFVLGWSRGGMETYLALKNNIKVNAAAVGGGLTDLVVVGKKRPTMISEVYKQLIPDFDKRGEELMRERSAVYWADKINVPVLILQGGADWRSDVSSQALAFVQKLQELGKTYELIIYANDDHGVSLNREDADRRIIEWFRRYMK